MRLIADYLVMMPQRQVRLPTTLLSPNTIDCFKIFGRLVCHHDIRPIELVYLSFCFPYIKVLIMILPYDDDTSGLYSSYFEFISPGQVLDFHRDNIRTESDSVIQIGVSKLIRMVMSMHRDFAEQDTNSMMHFAIVAELLMAYDLNIPSVRYKEIMRMLRFEEFVGSLLHAMELGDVKFLIERLSEISQINRRQTQVITYDPPVGENLIISTGVLHNAIKEALLNAYDTYTVHITATSVSIKESSTLSNITPAHDSAMLLIQNCKTIFDQMHLGSLTQIYIIKVIEEYLIIDVTFASGDNHRYVVDGIALSLYTSIMKTPNNPFCEY